MNVPVIYKSYLEQTPNKGYWDYELLERLLHGQLYPLPNGLSFVFYDDYPNEILEGGIVVIPARYHAEKIADINNDLKRFASWCIVILMGDEEAVFPANDLKHKNMKIWAMSPHPFKYTQIDRFLPNGYTPHTRVIGLQKDIDWCFMGQATHKNRQKCLDSVKQLENGYVLESQGFTQGLPPSEYINKLERSKIALCPSGPEIPDTFRLYEALELGCLPFVDAFSPKMKHSGYWEFMFGERPPFPIFESWDDVAGHIQYHLDVYPQSSNRVFAWWQGKKREIASNLIEDIEYLSKKEINKMDITILIPTSPIARHPDTSMIEETIQNTRYHFPKEEIIIMIDGVREEDSYLTQQYNEYIQKLLNKCNNEWENVLPLLFNEHTHQAKMTRRALDLIKTPNILFVEHDTPLVTDIPIPWRELLPNLDSGLCNVIRLHHEALVLDAHKSMLVEQAPTIVEGIPLLPTSQWSQRPHLARTDFYRNILHKYFGENEKTMIEDRMHGIVHEAFRTRGRNGWNDFKLWMYAPEGNMKRSYHLDGRKSK